MYLSVLLVITRYYAYLLNCTVILFLSYSFQTHRFTHPEIDAADLSSSLCIQHASIKLNACFCLPIHLPSLHLSLSLHGHLVTCDMGIYPPAIKHGDGTSPINFKVSIMETSSESSVYKSRGTSIYCGYHWCILLVL
jgi:hypothetical protein